MVRVATLASGSAFIGSGGIQAAWSSLWSADDHPPVYPKQDGIAFPYMASCRSENHDQRLPTVSADIRDP